MIRSKLFIFCLLAISTWSVIGVAQSQQPPAKPTIPSTGPAQAAPPAAPANPPESTLPADTPVITINGLCDVSLNGLPKPATHSATTAKTPTGQKSSASHSDCKTQVTRAQFEKLLKTVPNAPANRRRELAAGYVQVLTAANEGVKMGVDKDPDFSEQLALMRLQLLARDAAIKVQTEASKVSDAEIKNYYDQNSAAFEEVTLTRIFVPRPSAEASKDQPAPDAKAIADNAHQQLASGGEPEKIQKTVYEQLKLTTDAPSTKFGAKRRGSLPPAHEQKIFALKPGETSEVIQDSFGSVIYKVDGREELPLDKVKDQVKAKLTQQRIEDARQKIMSASKADYNDAYFGPETSGPKPGQSPAPPTIRPKAEGTPNSSPATGANPAPTQSANPKK